MTDEYVHNHIYYEVAKREDGTEYAKEVSSVTIKEAFFAGLRAGRPKWHKVTDKLPEENQWVLVYDGSYTVCNYHSYTSIKWLDVYENEVCESNIIAWCEIPKYTEE